jgi:hypothetical protein
VIVRSRDGELQLITQPDHAHLAGRIMERWVPLRDHPRRATILHAIAEHDAGWTELDAAPAVDPATGRIIDFISAPASVKQAVWPRAVRSLSNDPWGAALVAQHAITVYDRYRTDSEWHGFFREMEALRDSLVRTTARPGSQLIADYEFVRLGDLISLAFCTGWDDEQRFGRWRIIRVEDRVLVSPDAFEGAVVPFSVEGRMIPAGPFATPGQLTIALKNARTLTLRGVAAGTADP